MRKKIEKRSRKLIDFDGERHALQALQANPRRPEAKLGKQREALEAAKRTYEVGPRFHFWCILVLMYWLVLSGIKLRIT
jgi:hypothetical protein